MKQNALKILEFFSIAFGSDFVPHNIPGTEDNGKRGFCGENVLLVSQ